MFFKYIQLCNIVLCFAIVFITKKYVFFVNFAKFFFLFCVICIKINYVWGYNKKEIEYDF